MITCALILLRSQNLFTDFLLSYFLAGNGLTKMISYCNNCELTQEFKEWSPRQGIPEGVLKKETKQTIFACRLCGYLLIIDEDKFLIKKRESNPFLNEILECYIAEDMEPELNKIIHDNIGDLYEVSK